MSEQKPALRLAITCTIIVLGTAFVGSQLSTSGGLGEFASGIVDEDDASRDDSAASASSDETESYVVIGDEGATDVSSAPEGTVIFVEEDSELGRALAEANASQDGDQAKKDSADDEGGFPMARPKP